LKELKEIILQLKKLETCGELRVVYSDAIGANAAVMANSDKFAIVINPSLSYEQQIREILHEAKHICSHLNNSNYNSTYAEYDAEQFVNSIISKPDFFENLEKINNF
jgi:hypothetical protein